MDYFEKDLVIPFFKVLNEHRNGLPTRDMKTILVGRLNLTGTCNEDRPTRSGEKKFINDGIGKDFIIIQYIKPLGEMAITGAAIKISDVLKKIVPVCSNCHSMIHRDRDTMLSLKIY